MAIEQGEKIHVIIRRNFEGDRRRHFIGEALEVTDGVVRIEGYSFWMDTRTNLFVRKDGLSVRIVSLLDVGNIITVLPSQIVIDDIVYRALKDQSLLITDGKKFKMEVHELG